MLSRRSERERARGRIIAAGALARSAEAARMNAPQTTTSIF
ncbi:MAG: hypothetical protein ACLPY5_01885 [Candidatus Bathyarchaeia archaeon]